jgi:hypothetical protein
VDIPVRSGPVVRTGVAVALLLGLAVATTAPALAVENPAPRFYSADDVTDAYGGPGLTWSGGADYGPGRSGGRDDAAFAVGGRHVLRADDASEGNFGTRPFTLRFSALFTGSGRGETQVLSKRAACRDGSHLDVRTRDGKVYAELQGSGNTARVLHPADVVDGDWHVVTIGRNGAALSVTVDGETVTRRAAGVSDLDNSAPMRFGDGPCVGDETTRTDALLDDISYGSGVLPTEPPLVPGLPFGQPPLDSVLGEPGGILAPTDGDAEDEQDALAAEEGSSAESTREATDESPATTAGAPGGAGGRGTPLAAGAPGAGPAPAGPRRPTAGPDFPADSGAAAGIAAAVLPGAGDAADHSAYRGLDWTGVLAPPAPATPVPAPPQAPAPAGPVASADDTGDPGVAAVAFAEGLRSPGEVRWNLGAIAQSLLITLVFPGSGLLTSTKRA